MQYDKARQVSQPALPQLPQKTAADLENERLQNMTDEEYRRHSREVARKDNPYPPYNAGAYSYSEGTPRR
jgi:hypothetical protein